jgi:triacylglycerol lipase
MRYDPSLSALMHPEQQPPLGPSWPWNEAAILAECARLAYIRFENGGGTEGTLKNALATFGYRDFVGFFTSGEKVGRFRFDTRAFAVVSADRTALVVFRGTQPDSFGNIAADASFLPTGWAGRGKVHSGFWGSLQEALDPILTWLDSALPSRLIITGHSLGAAQATLLAGIRREAELVTFGSPLVGDADFAASFAGRKMARYVDCLDLVTRVPALIYRHLDGLQYIDRHGKIHQGGLSAMGRAAERLAAWISYAPLLFDRNNCPARDLADHAPINYVSAILGVRTDR